MYFSLKSFFIRGINFINVLDFIDFSWVEGELCEVNVILENPLPIELKVSSMVSFCSHHTF